MQLQLFCMLVFLFVHRGGHDRILRIVSVYKKDSLTVLPFPKIIVHLLVIENVVIKEKTKRIETLRRVFKGAFYHGVDNQLLG